MPFIRLSSRLTVVYKLIIPLAGLIALTGYIWLMLSQHWLLELHGVIALSFLAMLILFTAIISIRIKHVFYNDEFIRIKNYGQPTLISVTEYKLLRPSLAPFGLLYILRTSAANSLFLGSFTGTLATIVQSGPVFPAEPENVFIARKVLSAKSRTVSA